MNNHEHIRQEDLTKDPDQLGKAHADEAEGRAHRAHQHSGGDHGSGDQDIAQWADQGEHVKVQQNDWERHNLGREAEEDAISQRKRFRDP